MSFGIIVRLELTPVARKQLDQLCERNGMTLLSVGSRLMEWISNQPESIQAAILRNFPERSPDETSRMIVEHMAGEREGSE